MSEEKNKIFKIFTKKGDKLGDANSGEGESSATGNSTNTDTKYIGARLDKKGNALNTTGKPKQLDDSNKPENPQENTEKNNDQNLNHKKTEIDYLAPKQAIIAMQLDEQSIKQAVGVLVSLANAGVVLPKQAEKILEKAENAGVELASSDKLLLNMAKEGIPVPDQTEVLSRNPGA